MKKFLSLFYLCILLLLGGCTNDDETIQKEEEPILEDVEWAYIEEDALGGWSDGFCSENCYALIKNDTLDRTDLIYINSFKKGNDGIVIKVDLEGKFYTIISNKKTYTICREGNKGYFSEINKEGKFENTVTFTWDKASTSRVGYLPDYTDVEAVRVENLKIVKEAVGYIDFSLGLSQEFIDRGFLSTVAGELLTLGVASKLKLLTRSKLLQKLKLNGHDEDVLDETLDNAEGVVESALGFFINGLMGNIGTEIERVYRKQDITGNTVYYVDVRITGINSVPTTWKDFLLRNYENDIYCTVVAGNGYDYWNVFPSYYNCQSMSGEFFIPRGSNTIYKTFTIIGMPGYGTIKFRPLVISSKERASEVNALFPRGQFIEYGSPFIYENKYSSIYWCETTSVHYESNKIQFKGYVEVNNYCDDGEQWGIYYIGDNGTPMHFQPHNSNLKTSLIQFTVPIDDLHLNYTNWEATFSKELGVYHINEEGLCSYYGELENFDFVYDTPPSIKFTNARILGTREENNENGSRAAPGPGGDEDEDDDEDEEEDDDDDEDDDDKKSYITSFTQTFDIKGSLWISRINYVKDEGSPTFEAEAGQPMTDKSYTTKGTISYKAKTPNLSAITRYSITLRNGKSIELGNGCYYNRLYWSGENKITDVDWR